MSYVFIKLQVKVPTVLWLQWNYNSITKGILVVIPRKAYYFSYFLVYPQTQSDLSDRIVLTESSKLFFCFLFRHQEQAHMPMYHPTPSQARLATQLTEEEQIRIAQRIGLIQHLPKGVYDGGQDGSEKKIRE